MNRSTRFPDTRFPDFAGPGAATRAHSTPGARHDETEASPSYVQSILFGRRWMRGSNPGSNPGTTRDGKARVVSEQERN